MKLQLIIVSAEANRRTAGLIVHCYGGKNATIDGEDGRVKLFYRHPLSPGHGRFLADTLASSEPFRNQFVTNVRQLCPQTGVTCGREMVTQSVLRLTNNADITLVVAVDANAHCIDYLWNRLLMCLVLIKMELYESLNWMSTLGGAYSCLGETDKFWALKAGNMSKDQLKLSHFAGDPNLVVRCAIYKVYSLCQLGQWAKARWLLGKKIYPCLSHMVINKCCDNVVKNMYKAALHKIKHSSLSSKG
ncbi:Uncharacterized protein HDE_02503 [Halotydeus destructor]|nr:Uncharacterized protein HDE_02503 [Halotydeus destructor]